MVDVVLVIIGGMWIVIIYMVVYTIKTDRGMTQMKGEILGNQFTIQTSIICTIKFMIKYFRIPKCYVGWNRVIISSAKTIVL